MGKCGPHIAPPALHWGEAPRATSKARAVTRRPAEWRSRSRVWAWVRGGSVAPVGWNWTTVPQLCGRLFPTKPWKPVATVMAAGRSTAATIGYTSRTSKWRLCLVQPPGVFDFPTLNKALTVPASTRDVGEGDQGGSGIPLPDPLNDFFWAFYGAKRREIFEWFPQKMSRNFALKNSGWFKFG